MLINGNLDGINLLNAKETILKKINVSFIVHFCFGQVLESLYFLNSPCILL